MSNSATTKNGKAVLKRGPYGGYQWTSPAGEAFAVFVVHNQGRPGRVWMVKGNGKPAEYPDLGSVRVALAAKN